MRCYDQAMKHWKNHRKDRFTQQCNGYSGDLAGSCCAISKDRFDQISKESMAELLEARLGFPVYVVQDQNLGLWQVVPKNHIAGERIDSQQELERFASDYA